MSCKHLEFNSEVKVTRIEDPNDPENVIDYRADIQITCALCGMPFRFIGLLNGYSENYPTSDISLIEARMPIEPIS